jgi:hypothetical protein
VLLSIPPDKVTLVALYESPPGPSETRLTLR